MTLWLLLKHLTSSFFAQFGWLRLGLLILLHMLVSFGGLLFWRESHLIKDGITFAYFYLTTTTTVGYGDLSPTTEYGRLFVAGWMMLGGIALITTVIGKATNSVINIWRRYMQGQGDYANYCDHTLVIGWEPHTTERVIELLFQDETSNDERIILCDSSLEENPFPGRTSFVKVESLTSANQLTRAGVQGAERILVRTRSDEQTLAIVLTLNQLEPSGHVVAHFDSSETATLARSYASGLECTSSMALEMLVRSSQDPGSSSVTNELLKVGQGATQYCLSVPEHFGESRVGHIYQQLKDNHNATLVGYRAQGALQVQINPEANLMLRGGGELFYIASHRLQPEQLLQLWR